MKKFTLSLVLIAACGLIHAQSLSPFVVSSSGNYYPGVSGGPSLSFTVAEMSMVETFSKPNNILTQGFQQPFDFGTSVPEPSKDGFSFLIYPNPSSGNIHLALNTKNNSVVNIRLVDVLGKTVATDRFNHASGVNSYAYNWNNLSNGMYILEVILTNINTNVSTKSMKKINIIY